MDLNTMTPIGLLARFHNPPTIFLKGILKGLVLIVFQYVATFHLLR